MEILELLKNPLNLKEDKLFLIQNELEEYPYFQALHLLQAKALKNGDKTIFNEALECAAMYCSNREILFDYLSYTEKEIQKEETRQEEQKQEVETCQEVEVEVQEVAPIEVSKPKKEEYSFSQWLKSGVSEEREEKKSINKKYDKNHINTKVQDQAQIEEKLKIINEFLEKNPKISPPNKEEKPVFNTPKPHEGMSHLMTETLAKIYVEQKKYDKAITAYNILRLKYPEKSGFFADQINYIKELKNY